MSRLLSSPPEWVPESCTLPTAEQPIRTAEFDHFFATDVIAISQRSDSELVFTLRPEPEVAARAADLAARETACCAFFAFELSLADGTVTLSVSTGMGHEPVLAALADRARDAHR